MEICRNGHGVGGSGQDSGSWLGVAGSSRPGSWEPTTHSLTHPSGFYAVLLLSGRRLVGLRVDAWMESGASSSARLRPAWRRVVGLPSFRLKLRMQLECSKTLRLRQEEIPIMGERGQLS